MSSNAVIPLEDFNNKHNNDGGTTSVNNTFGPSKLNVNLYATKKTIAQGMLDIALLTANAAQLKYVLLSEGRHQFYYPMMVFISLSIILQIVAGVGQLLLVGININHLHRQHYANVINNAITILVFIITVINVIISAFGIEDGSSQSRSPTTSGLLTP